MSDDMVLEIMGMFDAFNWLAERSKAKNKEAQMKSVLRKLRKRLNQMYFDREV